MIFHGPILRYAGTNPLYRASGPSVFRVWWREKERKREGEEREGEGEEERGRGEGGRRGGGEREGEGGRRGGGERGRRREEGGKVGCYN